jgi:hypothetical protein
MLHGIRVTARKAGRARWAGEYLQEAQKVRPARPQRVKSLGLPSGYREDLNDARTKHGKRRVSARRGWAGEESDVFSILLVSVTKRGGGLS